MSPSSLILTGYTTVDCVLPLCSPMVPESSRIFQWCQGHRTHRPSPGSSSMSPILRGPPETHSPVLVKIIMQHTHKSFGLITLKELPSYRERERTNERTNEFFINEGKGISTILFFIQPSGKTKSTKTIKNKIIINSKTHINY